MAFFFPFSNLHELNLDWILAEVKKFSELIPPMETITEDVANAVDTANEALLLASQASQGVIADGAVTTSKLADDAVTEVKIHDGAVTADKIDNYSITTLKLASSAVTEVKIADGAVTTDKIADDSVTWDKLAAALQQRLNYKIIYLKDEPCTAITGDFVEVVNARIGSGHVIAALEFADPSLIVGNLTWGTIGGKLTINGTCTAATTCNIVLVEKGN